MIQLLKDKFLEIYGEGGPIHAYFAPGRVNLIGDHTDYNGGHVFPCAIAIGTHALARERDDLDICLYSMNFPQVGVKRFSLDDLGYRKEDDWTNFIKGILVSYMKRGGKITKGLDVFFYGELPTGLGVASSASIEILMCLILKDFLNLEEGFGMVDIALLVKYSENEYLGMNAGIMDPFTIAMGKKDHAIFLDTSNLTYEYAPLKLNHEKIIISNSGKERLAVAQRSMERRRECEQALKDLQTVIAIHDLGELTSEVFEMVREMIKDPVLVRRARHAVTENERTMLAVEALKRGDLQRFGRLMNESHISLRDDYEMSCMELDVLVEEAWKIKGVIGSRLMGAGCGGCTVSIVSNEAVPEFLNKVGKNYKERTGRTAEFYVVETGDGATIL